MRRRSIGVLCCLVLLAACGSATPSAAPSATPLTESGGPSTIPQATAPPTSTPSPTTPPVTEVVPPAADTPERAGALGLDWSRVHTDRDRWGSVIEHGPGGWVHLLTTDGEIPSTPQLMRSSDLTSWEEVTPPGDVVACGDGGSLAASATTWLLRCGGLWRSADGRAWSAVKGSTDDGLPLTELRRVVSDGQTFVAVRGEYPADDGIWASPDGQAWTKVNLPGAPFVRVDALEGRPEGGFILAGRAAESAEGLREANDMQWSSRPGTQAIWSSSDGVRWTAMPLGEGWEEARITGLATDGPGGGIVAVGLADGVEEAGALEGLVPAVWRSVDESAWQRLAGPAFALGESNAGDMRVVATSDRWLVIGARMRNDATSQFDLTPMGVAAGSEDGSAWWAVGPVRMEGDDYGINDVAVADGRLAILGTTGADTMDDPGDAAIWVSPPLD